VRVVENAGSVRDGRVVRKLGEPVGRPDRPVGQSAHGGTRSHQDHEAWMTMVGGRVGHCKQGRVALCPGWRFAGLGPESRLSTIETDSSPQWQEAAQAVRYCRKQLL
jgi:hypothetical protein